MLVSLGLSFGNPHVHAQAVGLQNTQLLSFDTTFWKSLNTAYYVFLSIPLTIAWASESPCCSISPSTRPIA
jgi:ABC-type sugar transport system permease subunit